MKKTKQLLSAAMVLLLTTTLPVTALAQEYDLADGSIEVSAEADGKQYVSQVENEVDHVEQTSETVITNKRTLTTTENTITITAEAGQTAEVTLSDVIIDVSGERKAAVSTKGEGNVTIELDKKNTIQSGNEHAGLEKNNTGELTITDSNGVDGSLDATGGNSGAGIGGDYKGSSNITIWGDAQVTAKGGDEGYINGCGASIGNGGSGDGDRYIGKGEEVTLDTSELTAEGSVNGTSGNHVHTWDEGAVTVEPTCAEAGVMTYTCTAGKGFTKTEEIAATGKHNIVIDSAVTPTYTSTGLTAGQHCTTCDTQTIEQEKIPMLQHKTTPSAAANATGEVAENSAYAAPSETPLYRVIDAAGTDLAYTASQENGVLTITVNQETAILTGYLSGISQLKAQGIETIIFGTNGRASAFRLEDLLANGNGGDHYRLVHSGAAAAFTIGAASTDISAILF